MRALLVALVLAAGLLGDADAQEAPKKPAAGQPKGLLRSTPRQGKPRAGGTRAARPPTQLPAIETTSGELKNLGMGPGLLKQGNFRAAAAAFRQEILRNPDSAAAHVGLGRALARLGRCEPALEHLWPYTHTTPFGGEAALVAAACSSQLGLDDDALYFERLGLESDPDNIRLLTQYALDLDRLGYEVDRDEVLERLLLVEADRDASEYARAAIAVRRGDVDAFDAVLFRWQPDTDARSARLALEGQMWLDLDEPALALDILGKVRFRARSLYVRQLRAEALRRLGEPEMGLDAIETRSGDQASAPDLAALRVRIYADLGRFDEAREQLAAYSNVVDPDVLAAGWYLARATGATADAARWSSEWAAVNPSALRTLEALLPYHARAPKP